MSVVVYPRAVPVLLQTPVPTTPETSKQKRPDMWAARRAAMWAHEPNRTEAKREDVVRNTGTEQLARRR